MIRAVLSLVVGYMCWSAFGYFVLGSPTALAWVTSGYERIMATGGVFDMASQQWTLLAETVSQATTWDKRLIAVGTFFIVFKMLEHSHKERMVKLSRFDRPLASAAVTEDARTWVGKHRRNPTTPAKMPQWNMQSTTPVITGNGIVPFA